MKTIYYYSLLSNDDTEKEYKDHPFATRGLAEYAGKNEYFERSTCIGFGVYEIQVFETEEEVRKYYGWENPE